MNLRYIRSLLSSYSWDLAFGLFDERIISNGLETDSYRPVYNPYKKKWFADPFILCYDEKTIQLLVEEFDKDVNKGRIARIVISKEKDAIVDCSIILELDSHLSFPAIYRQGDEIYVHPENSASGRSIMYRYDREKDKLVDGVVLVDKPLTDAVIINNNGVFTMYTTMLPKNSGPELFVFESSSLFGHYTESGVINFGQKTARMAGAMKETSLGLIRPAQDCTHDYGEAVMFYRGLDVVGAIRPPKDSTYAGVHTFNTLDGIFVIDMKRYNNYRLRKLAKAVLGKD